MREILFRAKTTDEVRGFKFAPNGTWVYGFYADKVGLPVVYQFEQGSANYVDYEVDRTTLGQFTGLTDKNDKKIFEGDIIKTPPLWEGDKERFWEVSYEGYAWAPFCWDDSERGTFSWDDTHTEVVGNIYDNPELLKRVEK